MEEKKTRPSWDEYFMSIAELSASMSTCLRRQVGAVVVIDKRIVATGFNGAPPGMKHCSEVGCMRQKLNIPSGERHELCRANHAEENLIIQAAITGVSIKGAIIVCTHSPCSICTKKIIALKPEKVIYKHGYPDELAKELFEEAGIPLIKFGDPA